MQKGAGLDSFSVGRGDGARLDKRRSCRQLELRLRPFRPGGCADGGDWAAHPSPSVADYDFLRWAATAAQPDLRQPCKPPRPTLPTPPHPRDLTRSRHAWALGSLSGRPGRGGENSVIRGCWFLPSSVPQSTLDPGAQPSVTRIRRVVPEAARPGVIFRLAPLLAPPARPGRQAWKRPGSCPAVQGRDFLNATKEPRGGPGAGQREAEGAGGPPPRAGRLCSGSAQAGTPACLPNTHHAGSGSPGLSPCPTGGAAGGGRRGTLLRGDSAGGLGSQRSAVEGPERTAEGRRLEVGPGLRSAPRPSPRPRPLGPPTRVSPRPSWGSWRRAEVGASKPGQPWPGRVGASQPEIARSLWLLASSAAATHRPRALSLPRAVGPHALPAGALPGLG